MTMATIDDGLSSVFADAEARGEDEVIEAIDRVTADWGKRIDDLLAMLLRTPSAKVRNAAAIALVEMNARAACVPLVTLLRQPGIGRDAGTLLYALDELGASLPLDLAIDLIENGSYEARAETLLLLQAGRIDPVGGETRETAFRRLSALRDAQDPDLREAATIALAAIARRPEFTPAAGPASPPRG